jgi:hypothetical protein
MKIAIAFVSMCVTAVPCAAVETLTSTSLPCDAIHSAIEAKRTLILRHAGKKGLPIYDKVVSDPDQCNAGSGASQTSYFPARDTDKCAVKVCIAVSERRP